ncbi:TetR/AcrR family transcriptional regulator [Noviherbaspirillum saxi]|uniref:TetR/AcrR family transcriptional regulator n=1 Tax=Noviherbaspirillum saxi TaxID=2320863 RepID=A0A3A3FKA0_9BURK|nr:TetR/AcrR family transcriptional regulator [Noviherbaspirillum saxi]RJF91922.1 TetR/AcrR family transcriptional regulator [Noviherbaspirillum saxi]
MASKTSPPAKAAAKSSAKTATRSRATSPSLPSPWSKTRDIEREREAKRDAVLRTAAQIFNEKGFHATSLDEVAERLQITKPTLYYYVKNKDDILFQCVSRGLDMMQEAIRLTGQSGGTARDKLVAAMRQYAEIVTMDFGMCVIRVGEDPLPPESRKKLRQMKGAIDLEFRELIRQGIEEGTMVKCDPKMAAFAIAGALSWIGRWYRSDGPQGPQEIADQFINLLECGLCSNQNSGSQKTAIADVPKRTTRSRKTAPA